MSIKKDKYIDRVDRSKDKIFVYTKESVTESGKIEFILRNEYKIKSLVHQSDRLFVYQLDGSYESPNIRFVTAGEAEALVSENKEDTPPKPTQKRTTSKRSTRRTRRKTTQDT